MNPTLEFGNLSNLAKVPFTIKSVQQSPSGLRITFFNATTNKEVKVDGDSHLYLGPDDREYSGFIDLTNSGAERYNSITIHANVERKEKDRYLTSQILTAVVSVPQSSFSMLGYAVEFSPQFVEIDGNLTVSITGRPNAKVWLHLGDYSIAIGLSSSGNATVQIPATQFAKENHYLQQIRSFISTTQSGEKHDTGSIVQVVPLSIALAATTATGRIPSLQIPTSLPDTLSQIHYPLAGLPALTGCTSTSTLSGSFLRVNSFSATKLSNDVAIVALSSEPIADTTTDQVALVKDDVSLVYLVPTALQKYSAPVRSARIIDTDATIADCHGIKIKVDNDIWADSSLIYLWALDGPLSGTLFKIVLGDQGYWYIINQTNSTPVAIVQSCFNFVAYGNSAVAPSLLGLTPLPPIFVAGVQVHALRPQIACNTQKAPNGDSYVYVVAEAPVNGAMQLFFYGFVVGTISESFGWQQLTYNGENRNVSMEVDSIGNLHLVWESSRCKPGQICYGILGPDSRAVINEVFIAALDKQAFLNHQLTFENSDSDKDKRHLTARLDQTLATVVDPPIALNLRDLDEYGVAVGPMWNEYKSGTSNVSIISDSQISVAGNPATQKFAAVAYLERDEFENLFTGKFSQISYQVSFDLDVVSAITRYSKDEVNDLFLTFKDGFAPILNGGINNYIGADNNHFTIGEPKYIYEKIIPIAGSFDISPSGGACADEVPILNLLDGNVENVATLTLDHVGNLRLCDPAITQIVLKDFIIALVPEKVRFLATNIESATEYSDTNGAINAVNYRQYSQQEHYTGNFRLALILNTAASISDKKLASQKDHVVRLFGDVFDITESHNYKIAIHYAHLRSENVSHRVDMNTVGGVANDVRFSGNIIVAVDNKVQGAESFVADFTDHYHRFDIGLGVTLLGEYRYARMNPYETLNDNITVTLDYSKIAIGPHTIKADNFLTWMPLFDRNVRRMWVKSSIDESSSLAANDESFLTSADYWVSLGLRRSKISLGQIPITQEGRNSLPNMTLDACDKVHVSWQSDRDGEWEIYYSSSLDAGNPFRFDTRITKSPGNSLAPSIGVDGNGKRLIAWHDNRTGNYQIFAARSNVGSSCLEGKCVRDNLSDTGLTDLSSVFGEYLVDDYIDIASYANVCTLKFKFINNANNHRFHFRALVYYDAEFTSLYKILDTRFDIANWSISLDGGAFHQIPSIGELIYPGQTAEVVYTISKEDGMSNEIYYIEPEVDDGLILQPLERTSIFFCPIDQVPKCHVPCLHTNTSATPKNAHFRVTFYKDIDHQDVVLSADSSFDQNRWFSQGLRFSTVGVQVQPLETINVIYHPEFLPLEISEQQNSATVDNLLCNVTYYVVVESIVDGTSLVEEQFAIRCDCKDVVSDIWKEDKQSSDWLSSAQGMMDMRITNTNSHALFASVAGSKDNILYIAWEDYRKEITPLGSTIYYSVWDSSRDVFYSSAQSVFDVEVGSGRKPYLLVSNLQHPTFLFQSDTQIIKRSCSLYFAPPAADAPAIIPTDTTGFTLSLSGDDAANCLSMEIYKEDVANLFHANSDTPIALITECSRRLDVIGPPGTYAIRFKNENATDWSDWLSVLPRMPNYPYGGSSSSSTMRSSFEGFFLTDNRFVIPWVFSAGSGNKTVTAQILTYYGVTPEFTLNTVARYRELKYTVDFYLDSALSKPATVYNGIPVVSTKAITSDGVIVPLNAQDVSTITSTEVTNSTIYIKVVFEDPAYLSRILAIQHIQGFSGGNNVSCDVILPGKTIKSVPLTPLVFAAQNPFTTDLSSSSSGQPSGNSAPATYSGSFTVAVEDGFENQDGLGVVVVNVPSPCSAASAVGCGEVLLPEEVQAQFVAEVAARDVPLQSFGYMYNRELACSFMSTACVDGTEPTSDGFDDEVRQPLSVNKTCASFDWTVAKIGEPCFYFGELQNSTTWVIESPIYELDFSDSRQDYLKFGTTSELDGILYMIKPNESITATPSFTCDSSYAGGGTRSVALTAPSNSFFFKHTVSIIGGVNQFYYCHGPSTCSYGSTAKAVDSAVTIALGSINNDHTDGGATISYSNALGINFIPLSSIDPAGTLQTTFAISVSRTEMFNRSFISSSGILRFKFAFVPTGAGHVSIRDMTCGISCEGS